MCLYNEKPPIVVPAHKPIYGWRTFYVSGAVLEPITMSSRTTWRKNKPFYEADKCPGSHNETGLYAYHKAPKWWDDPRYVVKAVARVVAWGVVVNGTVYPWTRPTETAFRAQYMAIETLYVSSDHVRHWLESTYTHFPIIVV